jgi:hypothetical protein
MPRSLPVRRHTRYPVQWPALYSGEDFIAEGTVIDITALGWRIAGPMPVQLGMRLRLHVWPPDKANPIWIEEATVLWVRGQVFGVELNQARPADEVWLMEYLEEVLGLWLVPHTASNRHRVGPVSC